MIARFHDRTDAGRLLAHRLDVYADREDVLVLALPRGGTPVAFEVAQALHAPLDVVLVRKLGVPGHEELAMGAIAAGGVEALNVEVIAELGIPSRVIAAVAAHEQRELERRAQLYRGGRAAPELRGRTVILVDDGLATGMTMRAAIAAVRREQPAQLVVALPVAPPTTCVVALPVAPPTTCEEIRLAADQVVCLFTPDPFYAVGFWYDDFTPTSDAEVCDLLAQAWHALTGEPGSAAV